MLPLITNTQITSTSIKEDIIEQFSRDREREESVKDVLSLIDKQRKYDSLYEVFISFMKKNEGYRKYPYHCLAGEKTVGYGHVIRESDTLSYPLSKSKADSLLREDFNDRISWIEKDLNLDRINEPYKVLSLAHFIFNVGQGNFVNSFMYKKLKSSGQLTKAIHEFVHIKTSSGYVESDHLLKMRKFEYEMFNKKV
jgi:GH24 family phage-related lysozyme (muramidase)